MCRLFGFRSVISSQVHRSLVEADNAILHQSNFHSDGWGVAYYVAQSPHLIKSTSAAIEDNLFTRLSGIVASETVVAHLRKATQGNKCITNAHPFQHGRWIFAHNGNICNFLEHRDALIAEIMPRLRRYILGSTDSEVFFYLLMSQIASRMELHRRGSSLDHVVEAARVTVQRIVEIVGPYSKNDSGPPCDTYLSFLLTDGSTMIAHHGGKNLYYSTYKKQCSERNTCPYFEKCCESPSTTGYVNHLIFSSEPLKSENVWKPMSPGQVIGVDWNMNLRMYDIKGTETKRIGETSVEIHRE